MPAPQAQALKSFIQLKFIGFGLKVPANYQAPVGDAAQGWNQAYEGTTSKAPASTPLFLPATMNATHVEIQKQMVADTLTFFRVISDAICFAWQTWQTTATMTGVLINGPIASLGTVVGPPWEGLITAQCLAGMLTPSQMKYARIIAKVISNGWLMYTQTIKVPGLPWYPAFATMALPVAPPVPNIPASLMMLTQSPASLSAGALKMMMVADLGDPSFPYHAELFEAVSTGFNQVFQIWQTTTMIQNVIGTGPVPTFAPPVVPLGPVVAGIGTMPPGGFI